MRFRKILFSIILSAIICVSVKGQSRAPHSLYFMETIPQILQMNPAYQPRANVYVALPINFGFDIHSDLSVRNILQKQGNDYYTPLEEQFDYKKFRRATGRKATMLNAGANFEIIDFGFRTKIGYFSAGISEHITAKIAFPSDFFKITENFFPENSVFDFSPLRVQGMAYMQLRFGYSRKINEKLTVGVNMKPLFGQAAITMRNKRFEMNTALNEWILQGEGEILSSSPMEVTRDSNNGINVDNVYDDFAAMDLAKKYAKLKNSGIAFDLGATYQIDERLSVSAALNNIGFISWKQDLSGMTYNGRYTFEGLIIDVVDDDINNIEIADKLFDNISDSLKFDPLSEKFRTGLLPVFYAGASYKLTSSLSAGFLSRTTFWQNGMRQSFNLSGFYQPYTFFAVNAGVTWQVKGNVYLGGGFTVFAGAVQFYFLTDYLPVFYSTVTINDGDKIPFVPLRQKTFTARFGMNLVFGKHGNFNKPMLDKGVSGWN